MRFEIIENFSVTFSSLIFSFCMAAIISAPAPFKWLCNFALYFSCRKNAVATTKFFTHTLIQRKKSYGLQPKSFLSCPKENYTYLCVENLSPHFFSRKNAVVTTKNFIPSIFMAKNKVFERLKSKEFTGCSNFCEGVTNKNKTGKGL